jgi:Mlc titration factor MtfA (ptsG expression regulator)
MLSTLSAFLFRWWFFSGASAGNSAGGFILMTIGGIILMMLLYYGITKFFERISVSGNKSVKLTELLASAHKAILSERFDYYNKLNKSDKELFEKRVRYYMTTKMFTSEDGYSVTDDMKVMISAAASQITFGLPLIANSNYTHILVMPNASMSPKSASRNTIVVPWREFAEGYSIADDGKNDGMKVMAAALVRDDRFQQKAYKILPSKKYENWQNVALKEVDNFMSGSFKDIEKDDRVRDEYFAMAVIYFFELPTAFKQKYRPLYDALSSLLGQDPAVKTGRKQV